MHSMVVFARDHSVFSVLSQHELDYLIIVGLAQGFEREHLLLNGQVLLIHNLLFSKPNV